MYKKLLRAAVLVFGLLKSDQYRNWDALCLYAKASKMGGGAFNHSAMDTVKT